jgi:hypothetical protein
MPKATVSLRAAAKALGMPPTSLARWLEQEPTLAAAVVHQPGPRQAMAINLECLQHAWAALQGGNTPMEELSDRERLRRERQQRLYWQGQELKQQVLALEQQHVLGEEVEEARTALIKRIHLTVEEWVSEVAPSLVDLDQQQRYETLSRGIHDLLTSLATSAPPSSEIDAKEEEPHPQQSETQCRIQIEHYRARLHQLRVQIHSKELIPMADVKAKAWAEARLFRDQLLAIPARCAPLADSQVTIRQEVMTCLPRESCEAARD